MTRGRIIFRKENGNLIASVINAVMRQIMSSLRGTDDKIMKQFA
jgi:hypothetical protein